MNTSQTAYSSSTRKTSSSDIPAIIIIASDIHPQMHMQQHQAPPAATRAVGSARPALLLAKVPAARGKTRSRGSAGAAGHTCPLPRAWVLTPACAARHGRKELPAPHVALAARPVIPLGAERVFDSLIEEGLRSSGKQGTLSITAAPCCLCEREVFHDENCQPLE